MRRSGQKSLARAHERPRERAACTFQPPSAKGLMQRNINRLTYLKQALKCEMLRRTTTAIPTNQLSRNTHQENHMLSYQEQLSNATRSQMETMLEM
ncbi:MAG: hypothetical protein Q7U14_01705, partial [Lacisediminimonas sp.]|nr:hypothetical protein [Lacisediminimonas sp.]